MAVGTSIPALFVSLDGLIFAYKAGEVSQSELDNGVFFLSCTRSYFLDETYWGDGGGDTPIPIVEAVKRAEKDGRAKFPRLNHLDCVTFEKLNEFLASHGIRSLDVTVLEGGTDRPYSSKAVKEAVEKMGLPIRVIHNPKEKEAA
jgi:hypothetical protein